MKSLQQLLSDWRTARNNMQKLQGDLPRIIGNESVKVVKNNFKIQGYDSGSGVSTWPARSPATNKRYDKRSGVKGSVYQSSNPILTQTKNLYNALRYYPQGNTVTIGVDLALVPYAKIHNEGGTINKAASTSIIHFKTKSQNIATGKLSGTFSNKKQADYAQKVNIGAHTIKMPQRKFIPGPGEQPNVKILTRIHKKVSSERDKALKDFKK